MLHQNDVRLKFIVFVQNASEMQLASNQKCKYCMCIYNKNF